MSLKSIAASWTFRATAVLTLALGGVTAQWSCTGSIDVSMTKPAPVDAAGVPLLGLPADYQEKAAEAYAAFPQPFRVAGADDAAANRKKQALLFKAELLVETDRKPRGEFYPAEMQQTGDCVSWGTCRAIFTTSANQVATGKASALIDPYQPHQYGGARVTVGGGRPRCNQAGAYPDDSAAFFRDYGYISYSEAGEPYSGRLANDVGCKGPRKAWLETGKKRSGGDVYPARTADESIEALVNGYALTAGIDWNPGRTKTENGHIVTLFDGRMQGGHQVALIGYDGMAGDGQFIFGNSHGPTAHPVNEGDPPGSFRVNRRTFDQLMRTGTFWVFSSVPGFPANEIDWSVFDQFAERAKTTDERIVHRATGNASKTVLAQ